MRRKKWRREGEKCHLFLQEFQDLLAGDFDSALVTGDNDQIAGIIGLGNSDPGTRLLLEPLELRSSLSNQSAKMLPGNLDLDFILLGKRGKELLLGNSGLLGLSSDEDGHGSIPSRGALDLGARFQHDGLDDLTMGLISKSRGTKLGRLDLEPLGMLADLGGERDRGGDIGSLGGPVRGRQGGEHVRVRVISRLRSRRSRRGRRRRRRGGRRGNWGGNGGNGGTISKGREGGGGGGRRGGFNRVRGRGGQEGALKVNVTVHDWERVSY